MVWKLQEELTTDDPVADHVVLGIHMHASMSLKGSVPLSSLLTMCVSPTEAPLASDEEQRSTGSARCTAALSPRVLLHHCDMLC